MVTFINKQTKWTKIFLRNILVQFIEVLIHQILKLTRIYPDGIYGKRRKYDLAVFMSEHPLVNDFIKEVIEGINKKLSDPEDDIEGIVLGFSRGNKTEQKFWLTFPGFKTLEIDTDTDPDQNTDLEKDIMETLNINFTSLFLRLTEVMKEQKKEEKEAGEKREWWVKVESTVSGQSDKEGTLMCVFDFKEPFHLQLEIETLRPR